MAVAASRLGALLPRLPSTSSSNATAFLHRSPFSSSSSATSRRTIRYSQRLPRRSPSASATAPSSTPSPHHQERDSSPVVSPRRWRPLCLYHTQGKCALITDYEHLQKFDHDVVLDLQENKSKLNPESSDDLDYLLVLDLEGRVEIIEFPVLMINAKSSNCLDFFHRFVKPVRMSEHRVNEYIERKYGPFGVDRVWHDTAIPFEEVLQEFEAWLANHGLLNEANGALHRAAFVTCGNWDVKTKIPQQCNDSRIKLPAYFMEWINLKDLYLNFYDRKATGMRSMLKQLGIPLMGSHHLGIDDAKNIARLLQHMLLDGCPMSITARRTSIHGSSVEFLFENRINSRQYP